MDRLQHVAPAGRKDGRTIVTIVNSLTPAAMALNEFVAWRARHLPDETHIVISQAVIPDTPLSLLDLPSDVQIVPGSGDMASFLRAVRSTLREVAARTERAIVHVHYPRSGVLFHAARVGAGSRFPVLFTIHSTFSQYRLKTKLISAVNCIRADHVTIVSHAASQAFPGSLRRLRPDGFSVISNGVDLERVDASLAREVVGQDVERTADPRRFELVHVGWFRSLEKGHGFLLDVVRYLPDVGLTLIGDGPLRAGIEKRVEDEGLSDRVRFTGLLPRETVYSEMLAANLVVSPSLREGLPIAVLEAMALGKPILLSDIPPHREIQGDGSIPPLLPFDPGQWAAAIKRYASRSQDSLQAEGEINRQTVEREFTLARMHEEYTELYEALLERGR